TVTTYTAAGTWKYVGDNTGGTKTIKDFGTGTDYVNLIIADTNGASADTYQLGAGLSVSGTLTLSGGTFNANAQTVPATSGVSISGGSYNTGTANNAANFAMTGGTLLSGATGTITGNLTASGANISPNGSSATGNLTITGNLSLGSGTNYVVNLASGS